MTATYSIPPANPARAAELIAERRALAIRKDREAAAARRAELIDVLGADFVARIEARFPNYWANWRQPAETRRRGSAPRVAFPEVA